MALNLTLTGEDSVPRTLFNILKLEAGQGHLPESRELMLGSLGLYAVTQAGAQAMEHSIGGGVIFGLICAAVLAGSTWAILRFRGEMVRFTKTLTALAATGSLAAIVYMFMHVLFATALPHPLPTEKLLGFLLFPVILWNAFIFAFLYRNTKLRPIPAFSFAALYMIFIDLLLSPLLK